LAVADSIIAVRRPIQSIEKENDHLSLLVDQQVSDNLLRDKKIKGLTKKMDQFVFSRGTGVHGRGRWWERGRRTLVSWGVTKVT
jgi:hypothetical protein